MTRHAVIACLALLSAVKAGALAPANTTLMLTGPDLVAIEPASDTTLDAFMRDGGQFQVRVPKERFPISAPNCRKHVIVRMPAVLPGAAKWRERVASRWELFQSVLAVKAGQVSRLEVQLKAGPYQRRDAQGNPVLEYCNAFFEEPRSAGGHPNKAHIEPGCRGLRDQQ